MHPLLPPSPSDSQERQLKELSPGGAEHVPRPFVDKKKFSFRFPPSPRCSQEVIELEDVAHGYKDQDLFSEIDLCIERGDRIAILGPNGAGAPKSLSEIPSEIPSNSDSFRLLLAGAGKSTLLRLIMGREQPKTGRAEIVANNAVVQHFEQDQASCRPRLPLMTLDGP